MRRFFRTFWLPLQVLVVAALFAGSIVAILRAGAHVVSRDRQRSEILRQLARADDALAIQGAPGLQVVPEWPDTLEPETWAELDSWLSTQAETTLSKFPGLGGGYFIPANNRYFGHAGATKTSQQVLRRTSRLAAMNLPLPERDLIDDQVSEALDLDDIVERVVEAPPHAFAIRASPLRVNGRRVAVVWLLARLNNLEGLDRSVRSYQWATGLALGGLVLATVVAAGLAQTIRGHVAQRAKLEKDLRRNERLAAIGTMLAGVSHEMRNPLAGLRSAAQLWQRNLLSDEELASEVIGEVDRLDTIVGHLLMFSRAETKSIEMGSLNSVAAEAARLCRSAAEGQGIEMIEQLDPSIPLIPIDSGALLQVFRNLTSNAIDAMPDGGRLWVRTRYSASEERVEAIISDTGPGLSREIQDHLFEPFFTGKPHGTGLGLAIAREIVLAHRGEIQARNGKSGGAEFTISLPANQDASS